VQSVTVCCSMMYRSTSIFGRAQRLHNVTGGAVCCSVLQCVAACCSVLQCVPVCSSLFRCVPMCCSVLQCVARCHSVLQCVTVCCSVLHCIVVCCHLLLPLSAHKGGSKPHETATHCNTRLSHCRQYVAACCSALQVMTQKKLISH